MKKLFLFFVFLVAICIGGAQFLLPTYLESQVEQELNRTLKPTSQTVNIQAMPAFKLVYGQADAVKGTLENVKLGKLNFTSFHYEATDIKVNPISLLTTQDIEVLGLGTSSLEGVVVANDLQQFLLENIQGLENADVELKSNHITVSGTVNIFGTLKGRGTLEGSLELNHNELLFAPTRFTINGVTVGGVTSQLLQPISIYDFNTFPVPVKAESVSVEQGEIHIKIKPVLN